MQLTVGPARVRGARRARAAAVSLVTLLCLAAQAAGGEESASNTDEKAYAASIEEWHRARVARLLEPEGWLSLTGLFWLEEGETPFGADSSLPVVLPPGRAPARVGHFLVRGDSVWVRVAGGVDVRCDGEPLSERRLATDAEGSPSVLAIGSLRAYVIERGGRLAVRVKDREHPALARFEGIPRFPVDERWRVPARFDPHDPPRAIQVPDVTGFVTEHASPGALVFALEGREHRLDVLSAGETYFVVFGDASNGEATYGGGRFLSVPAADSSGRTFVDFNRAVNPPCAFTPFATCPLPSPGNTLDVAVLAGERDYGEHDH